MIECLAHTQTVFLANTPDTDGVVGVARVQGGTISGPLQGDTLGLHGLLGHSGQLRHQLSHDGLGLQIPDLDAGLGGSAQPVAARGEAQGVDDVATLVRRERCCFARNRSACRGKRG